jgi:hypothetical protein
MTLPTVFPTQYQGTATDFLKVKVDKSGAARTYAGTVTIASGAAATTIVGLVAFNKGARFTIGDKSVYCSNFGAATTTVDLGYIYNDNVTYTNNVDAWASAATAPQAGGFITVDEPEGVSFVAEADGWVAITINTAAADANGTITFNFDGSYDGLGLSNSNNQN